MMSELIVHLPRKNAPKLCLTKYEGYPEFTTIKIIPDEGTIVTYFIDTLVGITAFKNNMLWAFEKYIKEQTL